jgi:integrase
LARLTQRLSAVKVQQLTTRGWYPDGLGLYLQISASGTKSWVYRYTRDGKQRWHGLGPVSPTNSLKAARIAAEKCRQKIREGNDPIDIKRGQNQARKAALSSTRLTFDDCAAKYIESHQLGWKNEKHRNQWQNTLATYASPVIGDVPIDEIELQAVLKIIEPIWNSKTETANRVRQRIELVIDWATAMGFREGANPARWRGHIEKLLPKPSKVSPVQHHKALPYDQMSAMFEQLQELDSVAGYALQMAILNATRSSEVRLAKWDEFLLEEGVWEIPAERMKNNKPHRIPLSPEVIRILRLQDIQTSKFVFPGSTRQAGITEAAVRKLLKSLQPGVTLHGFRSTFRDWCAEKTLFPRELAEKALSHSLPNHTEAAYQRGDMFEKRRQLMDSWAKYCHSSGETNSNIRLLKTHANR